MPRLVVTLTMRSHFWRIMSWTRARDCAIGAFVWTATKRSHCSGVTSQNLIGRCRLFVRIVACPTPALLTRMSITPKRLRRGRQTGGRAQRFCQPACRRAFHAVARTWALDAIGHVFSTLARARARGVSKSPGPKTAHTIGADEVYRQIGARHQHHWCLAGNFRSKECFRHAAIAVQTCSNGSRKPLTGVDDRAVIEFY